jgi:hypothetical protein
LTKTVSRSLNNLRHYKIDRYSDFYEATRRDTDDIIEFDHFADRGTTRYTVVNGGWDSNPVSVTGNGSGFSVFIDNQSGSAHLNNPGARITSFDSSGQYKRNTNFRWHWGDRNTADADTSESYNSGYVAYLELDNIPSPFGGNRFAYAWEDETFSSKRNTYDHRDNVTGMTSLSSGTFGGNGQSKGVVIDFGPGGWVQTVTDIQTYNCPQTPWWTISPDPWNISRPAIIRNTVHDTRDVTFPGGGVNVVTINAVLNGFGFGPFLLSVPPFLVGLPLMESSNGPNTSFDQNTMGSVWDQIFREIGDGGLDIVGAKNLVDGAFPKPTNGLGDMPDVGNSEWDHAGPGAVSLDDIWNTTP